jgi:hypothetical protein
MEKKFNFVFITINLVNGHQYVGEHSSNDLNSRGTKNYLGSGILFLKKIEQYGRENFERKDLEFFQTKREAFDAQEKYIRLYKTHVSQGGYNKDWTGGRNTKYWRDESRKKISKIQTGRKHSEEQNKRHSECMKGRKQSEETKRKRSVSMIGKNDGKKRSAEQNKEMSILMLGKNKGKKHTEEQNKKQSERQKEKKLTEEHKINIGKSKKGKKLPPFSEEHKRNLKIAKIGYISAVKGIGHKQLLINVYGEKEGIERYKEFIKKQREKKLGKKMEKPAWNKGIPATEKSKEKNRISSTGIKHNIKIVVCPYCGITGGGGNMSRYHFNNCKNKKS